MESLPNLDLLKFNVDTLQEVRRAVNLSRAGEMKEAIDILEEWVKQQSHFTKKDFDRRYLESIIVISKGSLEQAKSRLDRACTLRTMMPNLFAGCDVRMEYQENLQQVYQAPLPRMTKDHCRAYIVQATAKKFIPNVLTVYAKIVAVFCEYIRIHDYQLGTYGIIDARYCDLSELAVRFTINEVRQCAALLLDCHGFRVKSINVISNSNLINALVQLVKQVIPAKIGDRIHMHKDLESIYKVVDRDILPKDFGGNEKTLKELHEDWIKELMSEEHQNYCREIFSAKTNESKRQTDKFNEQYLGMPGSFRTLKVD